MDGKGLRYVIKGVIMIFCSENIWNFNLGFIPKQISKYYQIRPYWINHPNDGNRDLTDEEIINNLGEYHGRICIDTIKKLEQMVGEINVTNL